MSGARKAWSRESSTVRRLRRSRRAPRWGWLLPQERRRRRPARPARARRPARRARLQLRMRRRRSLPRLRQRCLQAQLTQPGRELTSTAWVPESPRPCRQRLAPLRRRLVRCSGKPRSRSRRGRPWESSRPWAPSRPWAASPLSVPSRPSPGPRRAAACSAAATGVVASPRVSTGSPISAARRRLRDLEGLHGSAGRLDLRDRTLRERIGDHEQCDVDVAAGRGS